MKYGTETGLQLDYQYNSVCPATNVEQKPIVII